MRVSKPGYPNKTCAGRLRSRGWQLETLTQEITWGLFTHSLFLVNDFELLLGNGDPWSSDPPCLLQPLHLLTPQACQPCSPPPALLRHFARPFLSPLSSAPPFLNLNTLRSLDLKQQNIEHPSLHPDFLPWYSGLHPHNHPPQVWQTITLFPEPS